MYACWFGVSGLVARGYAWDTDEVRGAGVVASMCAYVCVCVCQRVSGCSCCLLYIATVFCFVSDRSVPMLFDG
jgi:hypothetical protein